MVAPLRLGIAGLGTVGASVVRLIANEQSALLARTDRRIVVVAVTARSKSKKRDIDLRKIRWVANPQRLAVDPEIDVFVELIGGEGDPAKSAVEAALTAGKSVVTANKALLARHGMQLAELAEKSGVALNFEAAVGGAIPIVKTLREGLAGNSFARIYGILNGTCNYILTRMEREKLSFAECLKDAQRLGYAEADPAFDIEGHDTAQKLAIAASLAFGIKVNPAAVYEGDFVADAGRPKPPTNSISGLRALRIGGGQPGIEQRVHPTMVPKDSEIAQVMGVTNALSIDADGIAPITLVGPGAGGGATASAVVADIGDIARGVRAPIFGRPARELAVSKKAPMQRHEGGYYIRLLALDRPGTFATIAKSLASEKISLESIVQRHPGPRPHGGDDPKSPEAPAPVILITYATTEDAVRRALKTIRRTGVIAGKPQVIRIEKS
jgi:homoserine dehydrogenase